MPGWISYQSPQTMQEILAFYQDAMTKAGFETEGEGNLGATHAALRYRKNGSVVVISLESGKKTLVQSSSASTSANKTVLALPTPTLDSATSASVNATSRVAMALNLLSGSSQTQSVFQS